MFKVNNKGTRTTPLASFWCFIVNFVWTYFTPCSSVSFVNFEQVNANWVACKIVHAFSINAEQSSSSRFNDWYSREIKNRSMWSIYMFLHVWVFVSMYMCPCMCVYMWNVFKVVQYTRHQDNVINVVLVSLLLTLNIFYTFFFIVSIVDIQKVNVCWE